MERLLRVVYALQKQAAAGTDGLQSESRHYQIRSDYGFSCHHLWFIQCVWLSGLWEIILMFHQSVLQSASTAMHKCVW